MSNGYARPSQMFGEDGRRLLLFLFFIAGVLLPGTDMEISFYLKDSLVPTAYLYTLCFGTILVFSASIWGSVLLPVCMLFFGHICGGYAEEIVKTFYAGFGLDTRGLLVNLAVVPLFFLVSVRGMRISAMLGAVLDRSGAGSRVDYNREYIPMAIAVLTGIIIIHFLIG